MSHAGLSTSVRTNIQLPLANQQHLPRHQQRFRLGSPWQTVDYTEGFLTDRVSSTTWHAAASVPLLAVLAGLGMTAWVAVRRFSTPQPTRMSSSAIQYLTMTAVSGTPKYDKDEDEEDYDESDDEEDDDDSDIEYDDEEHEALLQHYAEVRGLFSGAPVQEIRESFAEWDRDLAEKLKEIIQPMADCKEVGDSWTFKEAQMEDGPLRDAMCQVRDSALNGQEIYTKLRDAILMARRNIAHRVKKLADCEDRITEMLAAFEEVENNTDLDIRTSLHDKAEQASDIVHVAIKQIPVYKSALDSDIEVVTDLMYASAPASLAMSAAMNNFWKEMEARGLPVDERMKKKWAMKDFATNVLMAAYENLDPQRKFPTDDQESL